MAKPEKEAAVAELAAKLRESYGAIVTDYRGLPVKAMVELRRQLRSAGGEYKVVKNTMMRRAADEVGMPEISEAVAGPTAMLFTGEDAVGPAKALLAYAKQTGLPQVRAGMLGGKLYPRERVQELANLPGREVLLAMFMGALEAPIANLMSTLEAPVAELVATLEAIAKQAESASA
ncbi:MAG: 50S ribosomal protein L10 [Armatimonadota bacterium]|nr:MAG: 50S ribosomal protein L10 [Armatimonadota bacterium]